MEAKLLFKSGSTNIEAAGKKAIIDLSNVIQKESDWEVVVEGHTDTDALNSSSHPKSNWELSVLRATAVVDVMLSNSKLSPKQVMAAGRGEFHPIDKSNKAKMKSKFKNTFLVMSMTLKKFFRNLILESII